MQNNPQSPENCIIHSYRDCYKEQIIQLILNIQTKEFGVAISIGDQPDLEDIQKFYQKGSGNFWVALEKDCLIGTIGLIDIGNERVALRKMFVDENYRGKEKGVAKALLDKAIRWCDKKNIQEIYLGTTARYLAAHRFYEKNGFQEIQVSALPVAFPRMQVDTKFYRRLL